MIKFGYITELDLSAGMVRVNFTDDGIVSNPLPVSVPASKEDKYSFPFVINEHVWCLMDDNCEFGVVGGAIYSQKDKPPSGANKQSILINVNNGCVKLDINRQTGEVDISAVKITVTAPNVEIAGALTAAGALSAASFAGGSAGRPMEAPNGINSDGDVKADGISLKSHKYTGAGSGSPTIPPMP